MGLNTNGTLTASIEAALAVTLIWWGLLRLGGLWWGMLCSGKVWWVKAIPLFPFQVRGNIETALFVFGEVWLGWLRQVWLWYGSVCLDKAFLSRTLIR